MKSVLVCLLAIFSLTSSESGDNDVMELLWGSGSAFSGVGPPLDNLTLSCVVRDLENQPKLPYSRAFFDAIRAVQAIFYITLISCGITLNILVIVLVARHKCLRTVSFGVVLQIVVLDLIQALSLLLMSLINLIANRWVFGDLMCAIVGFLGFMVSTVRILLMFAFVLDRFLSVFLPYLYPKHQVRVIVGLSVASWFICLVCGVVLLPPPLLNCYTLFQTNWLCHHSATCSNTCRIFLNTFVVVVIAPAIFLPILLYAVLYCKARRIRKTLSAHATERVARVELHQREWRATITFFSLFVNLFVLTVPSLVISIGTGLAYAGRTPPPVVYVVQVVCGNVISLAVISNPIVLMRNADMRKVILKMKASVYCPKCFSINKTINNN